LCACSPAGFATRPRRATDGTVYVVVEGRGRARIEGRDFALAERDSFVVPAWKEPVPEAEAGRTSCCSASPTAPRRRSSACSVSGARP